MAQVSRTLHTVVRDYAGMMLWRERLTCRTCNDATVVRQPYMNDVQWRAASDLFLENHLCTEVIDL